VVIGASNVVIYVPRNQFFKIYRFCLAYLIRGSKAETEKMSSRCPYRLFAGQSFAVFARDALKHRRRGDKHSQQLNTRENRGGRKKIEGEIPLFLFE
jgi:hypothetical protein